MPPSISEVELELLIEQAKECETLRDWEKAINIYEQCVTSQCKNKEPYDRLILLYRKKRQKDDEIRILELGIKVFETEDKYQIRLDKINNI